MWKQDDGQHENQIKCKLRKFHSQKICVSLSFIEIVLDVLDTLFQKHARKGDYTEIHNKTELNIDNFISYKGQTGESGTTFFCFTIFICFSDVPPKLCLSSVPNERLDKK